MAEVYDVGDVIVLTWSVSVDVGSGATLADPSTVTLDILQPSGVTVHVEYAGGAGLIARDSVGVYTYLFPVTQSGKHRFRWTGAGTVQAADEGSFRVQRQRVFAP